MPSSGLKSVVWCKGICFRKKLISHNKGLHWDFVCLLHSKLIKRRPESRVVEIVSSTVENTMEFIIDALPVELIGMTSAMMCDYIKFCANRLLLSLGCGCHFKVGNPFEWMEAITLQGLENIPKLGCPWCQLLTWWNDKTSTCRIHNVQPDQKLYVLALPSPKHVFAAEALRKQTQKHAKNWDQP